MLGWDAINYKWQTWIIDFDSRVQNSIWKSLGLEKPKGWHIAVIIVLACAAWSLVIILPGTIFGRRKSDPCEKQWSRVQRRFSAAGVKRGEFETPTSYIDRLSEQWPEHTDRLQELLQIYQQGRFGKAALNAGAKRKFAREMRSIISQLQPVR